MKIAFFDTHSYERQAFDEVNRTYGFEIHYFETRLTPQSAGLAQGFRCVCSFANDNVSAPTLETLKSLGVGLIALRSAGFNHVDVAAASRLGIAVVRVPEYSPHAVAEHAVALLLDLNRKIHRAYLRVRELNFSLEGLVGFDLFGKTVGVIGTGRIGSVFAQIMQGFGCRILGYDLSQNLELLRRGVEYVALPELYKQSDIISLHVALNQSTFHLLNEQAFDQMKPEAIVINTGRGALIDTKALISALKKRRIGGACLDVYEEEAEIFFRDLSDQVLLDDQLARLLTFANVIVTSHQGFLTREALHNIALTTLSSVAQFSRQEKLTHLVTGP